MVTNSSMNNLKEKLRILQKQKDVSSADIHLVSVCLSSRDLIIKAMAARIVGLFKIKQLLPLLIDEMAHSGEKMSFPDSVASFGCMVIPILENKLKVIKNITFRKNVAFILGRLKSDDSIRILNDLANDESAKVRRVAVVEISHVAGNRAKKILTELLSKEKDDKVRFFIDKSIKSVQDRI
ncbi:MAG: HEAT repeat domain-containing protein [Candidatus Magasanikbacteria bacterium]